MLLISRITRQLRQKRINEKQNLLCSDLHLKSPKIKYKEWLLKYEIRLG